MARQTGKIEVVDVVSIKCDSCGRELRHDGTMPFHGVIECAYSFGHERDGDVESMDLCETCFSQLRLAVAGVLRAKFTKFNRFQQMMEAQQAAQVQRGAPVADDVPTPKQGPEEGPSNIIQFNMKKR